MKRTAKIILSSALSMTLCASLIAGSTFALFTSTAEVNVAITSGKVNVTTIVSEIAATSAKWDDDAGTYVDEPVKDTFTNGGTYAFEGSTLTLTNISAGDGVQFTLQTTNESNIAIKYQLVITDNSEDHALYSALKISVVGDDTMQNITSDRSTAVSDWKTAEVGAVIPDITVSIKLPVEAPDTLQDKQCDLAVGIYAVQENGHDETNKNVYLVSSGADLGTLAGDLPSGSTLALADDIACDESLTFDGKDVTVDMNGNELTLGVDGEVVADAGSTVTLTGGTITVGEENAAKSANFLVAQCSEGTATLNVDCTVDLDNACDDAYAIGADYFGLFASATGSGKATINILENADIHTTFQYGGVVGVGAGSVINMNGGKITFTQEGSSGSTASAVYAYSSSVVNMNGGTIEATGHNVAAIAIANSTGSFNMTDGKISIYADVGEFTAVGWDNSAIEASGNVSLKGGAIEVRSTIPFDADAYACAIYSLSITNVVEVLKDTKITIYKNGVEGGSDKNLIVLYGWSEAPVYDESGDTPKVLPEAEAGITNWANWTLEGTVELVRA